MNFRSLIVLTATCLSNLAFAQASTNYYESFAASYNQGTAPQINDFKVNQTWSGQCVTVDETSLLAAANLVFIAKAGDDVIPGKVAFYPVHANTSLKYGYRLAQRASNAALDPDLKALASSFGHLGMNLRTTNVNGRPYFFLKNSCLEKQECTFNGKKFAGKTVAAYCYFGAKIDPK